MAMEYIIENEYLRVTVTTWGAQIKSVIRKCDNAEHIWNADASVWGYHAPILFPHTGKVPGGVFEAKGKTYTCTFSIECSTILNNLDQLEPDKLEMVPSGGVILSKTTVTFYEGESVYDVLQRLCKEKGIHMESSWTPIYNSAYIEGIHNLYEFDCGHLSGWMYRVNGWYPNYGCSRYQLKDGDVVEWRYTCDLGNDIGGKNLF